MDANELATIFDELQGRLEGPAAYIFELAVTVELNKRQAAPARSLLIGAALEWAERKGWIA